MSKYEIGNKLIEEHHLEINEVVQLVKQALSAHPVFKEDNFVSVDMVAIGEIFVNSPLNTKRFHYRIMSTSREVVFFIEEGGAFDLGLLPVLADIMLNPECDNSIKWKSEAIKTWSRERPAENVAAVFTYADERGMVMAALPVSAIIAKAPNFTRYVPKSKKDAA